MEARIALASLIVAAAVAASASTACAGPLKCTDVEADHAADVKAEAAAFDAALAAKKLVPAALESATLGGDRYSRSADGDLHRDVKPWTPFKLGKRDAIAGETMMTQWANDTEQFVADASGNIWRVVRAPSKKAKRTVTVAACRWGCWGNPGSGMNRGSSETRFAYFLPPGKSFKGDVTIAYSWLGLVVTYVDTNCAPPP